MIEIDNITKIYDSARAVDGVSMTIDTGTITVIVGTSGSGKTTLLRLINRLEEPTSGEVRINGQSTLDVKPHILRRRIGYVFQSIGLFPHMNAAHNIGIGPRIAGSPLADARITELLEMVDLDGSYATRMPSELSGGQRQRIGVARALAGDPEVLLMDEPFGALDPVTRDALGDRVRGLHETLGLTTVMVTHDMAEALLLADRVLVMDAGQIVADETPASLLAGGGGEIAQTMVAVPRDQAARMAGLTA